MPNIILRTGWRWLTLSLLFWLLTGATATMAAPPMQETPPTPTISIDDIEAALAEARALINQAEADLAAAESRLALATNFLSLFEVFGVVLTVGAVVLGIAGWNSIRNAQAKINDLEDELDRRVREGVDKKAEELRGSLSREIAEMRSRVLTSEARLDEQFSKAQASFDATIAERQRQLETLESRIMTESANANRALGLLTLGQRQYRTGDLHGALETYEQAMSLDPTNPVIMYHLGYLRARLKQLGEAQRLLTHALEAMGGAFPPAEAALGFTHRLQAEMAEREVRAKDNAGLWSNGMDRNRASSRSEALYFEAGKLLTHALSQSPNLVDEDGESWYGVLGGLYKRRGQLDHAIEAYGAAAAVTPKSSYPVSNLAALYMKQKDHAKMLEIYARVEKMARAKTLAEIENHWAYADWLTAHLALHHEADAEADEIAANLLAVTPPDDDYSLETAVRNLEELVEAFGGAKAAPHIPRYIHLLNDALERRRDGRTFSANGLQEGHG